MELLMSAVFGVCVVFLGTAVGGITTRVTEGVGAGLGVPIGFGLGILAVIADIFYVGFAAGYLLRWGWMPAYAGLALVTVVFAGVAPCVVVRMNGTKANYER